MATFGQTDDTRVDWSVGASNAVYGAKFQCPVNGAAVSLSVHVQTPSDAQTYYIAIYEDNGGVVGDLITSGTGISSGVSDQWITATISCGLVASTNYWLVANRGAGAGTWHGGSGSANQRCNWSATAGVWADDPSASYSANDMCIYCTYNPGVTYSKDNPAKASIQTTSVQTDQWSAVFLVASFIKEISSKTNVKTTYYCGHTYDWKIDGKNRGYQG